MRYTGCSPVPASCPPRPQVAITANGSLPPAAEALAAAEAGQGVKPGGSRRSGLHSGAVTADQQQFIALR